MLRPLVAVAYASFFILLLTGLAGPGRAADLGPDSPFLLSLPRLTSPQAAIQAFRENGNIVEQELAATGPSAWTPRPAMLRMIYILGIYDGNEPPSARFDKALTAMRLKAVLDRLPPGRLADIPDEAAVAGKGLRRWQVPGTPIVLEKATSGPHTGEFLFTPDTVAASRALYEAAKRLPQPAGAFEQTLDNLAYGPGPLLPKGLIASLPAPLRATVLGQAVWQWVGLAVLLGLWGAAALRVMRWGLARDARETLPHRRFGQPLAALALTALCIGTLVLSFYALKIWFDILLVLILVMKAISAVALTWFATSALHRVSDIMIRHRGMSGASIDGQLIKVLSTLLGIAAMVAAVIYIADLLSIPVGTLLAGLGIGGLAIALAIRPTLENVIGGLTLFADRPIKVGELCGFGSERGTVEEIGLRTTKIRRRDDTLVTIPNSELARIRIENITRRRRFLFNPTLGLRYETTIGQLAQIERDIVAALKHHEKIAPDGIRVRLTGLGDYALNVDVFAYVNVTTQPDFLVVQQTLNLRIIEIVQAVGASFAFPSQTTYIASDSLPTAVASRLPTPGTAAP